VKKLLALILTVVMCPIIVAQAQNRLKTSNAVQVNAGFIQDTVVLADPNSTLFLEFLKGDRVAKVLDQQIYEGEILPPIPIDVPARAPRARMREILSFEVFSDTNEPLELIDQYAAIHAKKRLRLSLASTNDQRRQGAQLITTFNKDLNVGRPALWRYNPSNIKQPWQRLGGIMGETAERDTQIFSAFLYATGVYTIWDENPNPEFEVAFPIDEIELAEESPFPSVSEQEEILFEDNEFVDELLGEDALVESNEEELNTDLDNINTLLSDLEEAPLIPAVPEENAADDGFILAPVVTSQIPEEANTTTPFNVDTNQTVDPLNPTAGENPLANLQALPTNRSSLGGLLALPQDQTEIPAINEADIGQELQASTFTDFGVNEGDLPEAGGYKFPWALLFVIGVIGFSVYAIRQKPY